VALPPIPPIRAPLLAASLSRKSGSTYSCPGQIKINPNLPGS
jgi:hypothetical protein